MISNQLDPMIPHLCTISNVHKETADTFTFELLKANEDSPFSFVPGQFNMIYVFGTGEVPISISGNPTNNSVLIHTTRAVGTVTQAIFKLKRGDTLGIRGPFGNGWPIEEAEGNDVVIVAGGIGLAPLRPPLYHILSRREKYGKVVILYGARTPDDILFRRELNQWRSQFDLDVFITVDRASSDWRGNVGVVTTAIPGALFDPLSAVALLCGPEVMMRYAAIELLKRGVVAEKIFVSMERNMKCAIGFCGHCQYGPEFVCKDGPVFQYSRIKDLLFKWEV